MKLKQLFSVTCLLFLVWIAWVGTVNAEDMHDAAWQATKKGLLAVDQKDWNLAIRYFYEAIKITPQAPEVLFNLGLSESMVPGRELRAIAWFKAYLSANPAASNVQTVKDMIEKLEVRAESTIDKLIEEVKQLANQFTAEQDRSIAISRVAEEMAKTGDTNGAKQIASMINSEFYQRSIPMELAKAGDISGAKEMAASFKDESFKSSALQSIAAVQAEKGDTAGAWVTLDSCSPTGDKQSGMIAIAKILFKQDKKDEACQILVKAADLTAQSTREYSSSYSRAQQAAWQQDWKTQEYIAIGGAQAEIGDIKGALKTADLIPQEGTVYHMNANGDPAGSAVSPEYGDQNRGHIYDSLVQSYQFGVLGSSDDLALMKELASRMKDNDYLKEQFLSLIDNKKNQVMKGGSNSPVVSNQQKMTPDAIRAKQIKKWTRFIDRDLNKPLFMDSQNYIQSLGAQAKPWDIFNGIINAIDDTAKMLEKTKQEIDE